MEHKDWNYKTYLGDCIDGMRLLPAGSVDFLFTDLVREALKRSAADTRAE